VVDGNPSLGGPEGSNGVIDINLNVTVELAQQILTDEATADHIMRGIKDYIRRRLNGEIAPVDFVEVPNV
jgi:hypothetical protein